MDKLLRYFPLNQEVKKNTTKELLITILKYMGIGILVGLLTLILGWIPLIGTFIRNLNFLYKFYAGVGSIVAFVQYFSRASFTTNKIMYPNFKEILPALKNSFSKKSKIIIVILFITLCIIPLQNDYKIRQQLEKEGLGEPAEETSTGEGNIQPVAELEEEKLIVDPEEFYSYIRGYWQGDEISYTFAKDGVGENVIYYFFSSEWKQNEQPGDNIYSLAYIVTEYENTGTQINAKIMDGKDYEYELVLTGEGGQYHTMQIKSVQQNEWMQLTNVNCSTYEEFLNDGKKDIYVNNLYSYDNGFNNIEKLNLSSDYYNKYALLDVTSETEGEELILNGNSSYVVFGLADGVVTYLYQGTSFNQMERYNDSTKEFWFYQDNGTSGPSYYYKFNYVDGMGFYKIIKAESEEDFNKIQDNKNNKPVFVCGLEEDYALSKNNQEQEEEKLTINLEEAIVTLPLETYEGSYQNSVGDNNYLIDIASITQDDCWFTMKSLDEREEMKFGGASYGIRVKDGYDEQTYLYYCEGIITADNFKYSYRVGVLLKSDGSIFVQNIPGDEEQLQLDEGDYLRIED